MSTTLVSLDKSRGRLSFRYFFPRAHTKYVFNLWNETLNQNWADNSAIEGAIKGTGSGWSGAYYVGGVTPTNSGTATFTGVNASTIGADQNYSIRVALPDEGGGIGHEEQFSGAAILALPDPSGATTLSAPGAPQASSSAEPANTGGTAISAAGGVGDCTYLPPSPEPTADDGSQLSQFGADMQCYYVATYGQGTAAATAYVMDHNRELAYGAFSTSTPIGAVPASASGLSTLPAGVSGIGSDVGLVGGGGSFSSTSAPTILNQRQTGTPPPAVGGSVLSSFSGSVGGVPIWLIAAAAAAYALSGRR